MIYNIAQPDVRRLGRTVYEYNYGISDSAKAVKRELLLKGF